VLHGGRSGCPFLYATRTLAQICFTSATNMSTFAAYTPIWMRMHSVRRSNGLGHTWPGPTRPLTPRLPSPFFWAPLAESLADISPAGASATSAGPSPQK